MATGDIKNNLKKLQHEIKLMKYGESVDWTSMSEGNPKAFLPLYHFAFTTYSHPFAEKITHMDIEMFGKSDLRFMEAVYKVLRDYFNFKPPITRDQFFASGYAERKVIMCKEVLSLIREEDRKLQIFNPKANPFKVTSTINKRMSLPASAKIGGSTELIQKEPGDAPRGTTKPRKVAAGKFAVPHGRPPSAASRQGPSVSVPQRPASVSYLPGTLPSHVPQHLVQEIVSPNSSQSSGDSQYRSSAAPVSRAQDFRTDDSHVEVVDVIASTPSQSFAENHAEQERLQTIGGQAIRLAKSIDSLLERMERVEGNLTSLASTACQSLNVADSNMVNSLLQTVNTLSAKITLLENRVALLEAKIDGSPTTSLVSVGQERKSLAASHFAPIAQLSARQALEAPQPPQAPQAAPGSPVSRAEGSLSKGPSLDSPQGGAFVSVESVVRGNFFDDLWSQPPAHQLTELQRRRDLGMEMDTRLTSAPDGQFSLLSGVDDTLVSIPESGDPRRMSTPQRPGSDSALDVHFMDVSTQGRVKRITQLLEDTNLLVKDACKPQGKSSPDSMDSSTEL